MILKKYHITFIIFVCVFISCHKDTKKDNCVAKTFYNNSFVKQFQFKVGSFWLYQSSTNSNIDSMNIYAPNHSFNSPSNSIYACYNYELYENNLAHMQFLGGDYLSFSLNYDNLFIESPQYYSLESGLALINGAAPDSIHYKNGASVKLEARFDTLTILGTKYSNVYQMHYFPPISKFQRIWWCPNIGFVKFEYENLTGGIDTWELKEAHPIF